MRPPWRDRRGAISRTRIVALTATALPAAWMVHDWATGFFGPLPLIGLVYWSGVWAIAMILLTLAVTPIRRLFGWTALNDARRIIGVSALVYSIVHVVAFFALDRWEWPRIALETMTRPSLVVATASIVGLVALGTTSFDAAVRRLGAGRWSALHRLNYGISALAIAHFLLSPGIFGLQYVVSGFLFWLLVWRLLPARGIDRRPIVLALLSAAACLFTYLLQTGWLWVYQRVPPAETLAFTFSLDDEIAPPWQVLAAGLAVALAAAVFRRGAILGHHPPGAHASPQASFGSRGHAVRKAVAFDDTSASPASRGVLEP
ncbi:MAG: ferric reductase-like transmembrane domain-containing protein [Microvirga sp.]